MSDPIKYQEDFMVDVMTAKGIWSANASIGGKRFMCSIYCDREDDYTEDQRQALYQKHFDRKRRPNAYEEPSMGGFSND